MCLLFTLFLALYIRRGWGSEYEDFEFDTDEKNLHSGDTEPLLGGGAGSNGITADARPLSVFTLPPVVAVATRVPPMQPEGFQELRDPLMQTPSAPPLAALTRDSDLAEGEGEFFPRAEAV